MLGQYLNQQKARAATITETGTGFMVICFPDGNLLRQRVLTISHADLIGMDGAFEKIAAGRRGGILRGGNAADKRHPIVPQGYDAFLRALGHKLDQRGAVSVTICDTDKKIYVDFWIDRATFVIRDQRRTAVSARQNDVYDLKSATQLIETVRSGISQETARNLGALRINPHDYLSAISAAQLLETEGKYREAESFYARVVAQVVDFPEAHYHLARLALVREDTGAALTSIHKAMADHEDVAAYQDLLGCILRAIRKHKEAATAFERAAELEPENAIIRFHLARTYEALGRTEDAARQMAFSGSQQAAPAWDFPEEGTGQAGPAAAEADADPLDTSPAATALLPAFSSETSPAAAALLPPSDPTVAPTPIQTFTTEWSPALPGPGGAQPPPPPFATSTAPDGGFPVEPPATWTPPPGPPPTWDGAAQQWVQGQPAPQQWAQPAQPAPPPGYQPANAAGLPQPAPAWPQGAAPPSGPHPAWTGQPAQQGTFQPQPAPSQGWQPQPSTAGPPEGWQPTPPAAPVWVQRLNQPAPTIPDMPAAQPSAGPPQQDATAWYPAAQPGSPAQPGASYAPPTPLGQTTERADLAAVPEAPPQTAPASPPDPAEAWAGNQGSSPAASTGPTPAPAPTPSVEARAGGQDDANANAVELAAEIMMIQRAIEGEPNRADLHRKLGFLLARQGRTAEAATEFRKALQCSRTNL